MTTARYFNNAIGTQTSALAVGGEYVTATEEFTGGPTVVTRTVTGT